MRLEDFPDKGLLDELVNLKIERFEHGDTMFSIAPTWLINPNNPLESFLEDFANPRKKINSLRDFASKPQASLRPFFPDPAILDNNADPRRICPISKDLTIAEWFRPLAGFRYYAASDLSVSRDATGIALLHREFLPNNKELYVLDFTMSIKASHAQKIDYDAIENLWKNLKKRGFRIKKLAFDQFQSHGSAKRLADVGFDTEIVKYSDSLSGCGFVWDLIYNSELVYGLCDDVLIGEAKELQVINDKRIDHLKTGGFYNSKDVWDAVVNACVIASQDSKRPFTPEYLQAK